MAPPYGLRQPVQPATEPESDLNEFQKGFRRFVGGVSPAIDRTQATLQQAVGLDQAAEANLEEARAAEAAQDPRLTPRVGRVEEIRTGEGLGPMAEDIGSYAASVLGENLPLIGTMAVGGAAGGLAGRAVGATRPAAWTGAAVPYAGTSIAESSRDIVDDPNATGTPQEQAQGVLGTGLAKTALGMVPFGTGARMLRGPGSRLQKGSRIGATSAVTEGLTEVGEEAIGQFGKSQFVPGTDMFGEEARSDYLNALAGGAILGGPTGFAAGALAPQNAMQSAVEAGKSPESGLRDLVDQNPDLYDDQSIAALQQHLAEFTPGEPRSDLAKRMAQMEADEEIQLQYSDMLGRSLGPEFEQVKRRRARELSEQLAKGELNIDSPAIKGFRTAYPELFQDALSTQEGLISDDFGLGVDPFEATEGFQRDVVEPKAVQYNFKGQAWHKGDKQDATNAARKGTLDLFDDAQKTAYNKLSGEAKAAADKRLDEYNLFKVRTQREILEAQAPEGADPAAYALDQAVNRFIPDMIESGGKKQVELGLRYAQDPEAYLDEMFALERNPVPPSIDPNVFETLKPDDLVGKSTQENQAKITNLRARSRDMQEQFNDMMYGDFSDPGGAREIYNQYKKMQGVRERTQFLQDPEVSEVVEIIEGRRLNPDIEKMRREIANLNYEIGGLQYEGEGVITGTGGKGSKKIRNKRINIEEYDAQKDKWIEKLLDPMAAAIKAQKTIPYDPDKPRESIMLQVLEGVSSALSTRGRKIRLKGGIPGDKIVFSPREGKGDPIRWRDVEAYFHTDDGRKAIQNVGLRLTSMDEKTPLHERIQVAGEEFKAEAQPLGRKEQQTAGLTKTGARVQRDPGPYKPQVAKGRTEEVQQVKKPLPSTKRTEAERAKLLKEQKRKSAAEAKAKAARPERKGDKPLPKPAPKVKAPGPEIAPIDRERREAAAKREKLRKDFERGKKQAAARRKASRSSAEALAFAKAQKQKKSIDITKDLTREEMDMLLDLFRASEIPGKDKKSVDALIEKHSSQRQHRHQRLATKMAERVGMSKPRMLDTKEAVAVMVAVGDGHRITRKSGFTTKMGGTPVIYVNPTLPEDAALEVLGHELGHIVLNETWEKAPRKIRSAVKADFEQWLQTVEKDPSIYDVVSKRTPQRLLEHMLWGDINMDQKVSELSKKEQEYLLKFEEWFADNVAKWTVTDAKPRSLIDSFFKYVADLLKDLWSGLTKEVNKPEESIQVYMDRLFKEEPAKTYGIEHAFSMSEIPGGVSKDSAQAASSVHGPDWAISGNEAAIRKALGELLNAQETRVLGNLVHKNHIRRQLLAFYGNDPVALSHLDESNTQEMIVLAYKAWRAGELNLSRKNESIFIAFMERLAEILGVIMNHKNAQRLMRDLSNGTITSFDRDDRGEYVQERMNETAVQQARDVIERMSWPAVKMVRKIVGTADMRVRWAKNPALTELWRQVYLASDTAGGKEGFFAATRRTRANFERKMHDIFDKGDEAFGQEVVKILNKQVPFEQGTAEEKAAVLKVRELLREIWSFSNAAGVDQGYLGKDYFPRVYDMDILVKDRDEFIEMLTTNYEKELNAYYRKLYTKEDEAPIKKTPEEIAAFIHRNLTVQRGDEQSAIEQIQREVEQDPLGWPALDASKVRSLAWIKDEDIAPFLSNDLGLTLSTYIHQSAKRAEYNRRFGVGTGRKLVTKYLEEAKKQGASEEDLAMASNVMKATLGTLGADINPTFHRIQGVIMVLENWMLLGLATLTSLVDPMGIAVRGDLEVAWSSLKQGLREVRAKMKGDQTELSKMAGLLGINELHNTVEALGYEYGGYFVTGGARRWNERLFSVNMLSQWTRVTRTMALAGARHFLAKHRHMNNAQSKRFMQELGLREGDVTVDTDGNAIILDDVQREEMKNIILRGGIPLEELRTKMRRVREIEEEMKGLTENTPAFEKLRDEANRLEKEMNRGSKKAGAANEALKKDERVRQALNRWVDEAILRPDAAQRPVWASDPHWMLVFHLKAFIYSFHERILKRVGSEMMQGNYKPAVMLMGYLPLMFIAEALRNTFQGDDMEEDMGAEMGLFSTSHYLAQRAGLYGVGQFYFDVKEGSRYGDTPFSTLGGPSMEHALSLTEAAFTASEKDDERVAFRSLPFHNLYKEWFR